MIIQLANLQKGALHIVKYHTLLLCKRKNKDKLQFKQNIFYAVRVHYTKSVFLQKQRGH